MRSLYVSSRSAARFPILIRVSVHPLMADATSMVLSRSTAFVTMSTTFDMFCALATDVPPNFNTCIYIVLFCFFFLSFQ